MNSKINDVVLVVDDSPESLGMLNVALNTAGYTALVALNGVQALSIVEKVEPDVVLMDAIMPELDGFETCKQLKQRLPNVPVIFMTGLTDVEDVVKGFEAGGVDYVTKPIAPDEVIARIKTHVQTAKHALSAQNALDHAGKNVFCVNQQGQLAWATPQVHDLIEQTMEEQAAPWACLAQLIGEWLAQHQQPLVLKQFSKPLEIIFERQQDDLFLLRIKAVTASKQPTDLQAALPITKRESEVLYWLSFGKTNWEISQILEMSPRTVNKHLEQLYKKIGVDNRTAAASISIRVLEA
ncbi:DNA-binding response regulator [Saccharobesus litoralis]|uniref:DNA-binding response regulator n=1 Tax=Saccharobesus litoralis TaxID=2172099 RepID=A0A2S0VWS1_9ALTE|nr:DNA-binding response regulator [Saccharobesus litoralis]AWB68667.1 DNA-binding response regulator [Saccharobesus litoralis]